MKILGVDFTSSPRRVKPIIAAWGTLDGDTLRLDALDALTDWAAFEHLLAHAGPWVGAFDLPFGLPREMVTDLALPDDWPRLVRHCANLGRENFRALIDAYRARRPVGQKFAHRKTDGPAGSSSPMKLVNPPVALMFLEGAPRLLDAGVHIPALHERHDNRVAFEGYPGLLARKLTRGSYKSDTRSQQTAQRTAERALILQRLVSGDTPLGLRLIASPAQLAQLLDDASGDRLDATLCALQAAWAARRREARWGLPPWVDPVEGWIIGA